MNTLMRRRLGLPAVVLSLALALGACVPTDAPGSADGIHVIGQSRLTPAQLVSWYRANVPNTLPYRASSISVEDLANLFVSEGNRYNVRGDLAFAQSVVETAWFNFPDNGQVRPWNNNFSGIGACNSCGNGFQFPTPLAGVRAQIQLLRNYGDIESRVANIPDPPVPELWGSNPATAAYNFDHYFHKGRAPFWNNMGNGNWATAPNYGPMVIRLYNQMLVSSNMPSACPPDGLLFGPLTSAGPCPLSMRHPGRAFAPNGVGGSYALAGDGTVTAFRGAPHLGNPTFSSDLARDIAVMPDNQGYVVLDGFGRIFKYGSAARTDTVGPLGQPATFPSDSARSIAIMPDGKGYLVLLSNGTVAKYGSATAGAVGAAGWPQFADDAARAIDVMHDGAGYVVLDVHGTVWKYGSASAGAVGAARTIALGDGARDIELVWFFGTIGYYVLDAMGGVHAGGVAPRSNPGFVWFADRWRSLGLVSDGRLVVLRNDGVTFTAS
jgi:hypothetical protein